MRRKRSGGAVGLVVSATVAAILMAVALVGCGGDPRLPPRAQAAGQDNGSLTGTYPTAGEFERVARGGATDLGRVGR